MLYFRLVRALPDSIVLAQVQLSRFLGVKKVGDSQSWLNRINQMSADFVVCAKVRPGAPYRPSRVAPSGHPVTVAWTDSAIACTYGMPSSAIRGHHDNLAGS